MALVPCPECQKEVSTEALACPQCAFPYPGKKSPNVEKSVSKLHTCPDCGNPVSKQAHTCPHCGVSLMGERNGHPLAEIEGMVEETWLCPHCGTPYTRKVKRGGKEMEEPSEKRQPTGQEFAAASPQKADPPQQEECESLVVITEPTHNPLAKRRPALWQNSAMPKEIEAAPPRYPRSHKKSIFLVILVIILVVAAGGVGALWQLQGINPLEALSTWR